MGKPFICLCGNIGSGKTTVTNLLADVFGLRVFEEEVEDNPYLKLFYEDMHQWSYRLQRFFLFSRALMHEKINMLDIPCIQDRSIYEDMEIFAKNQYRMKLWSQEEYEKYRTFCQLLSKELRPPDLLIYLRTSIPILRERIRKRGRDYEQQLWDGQDTYLHNVQKLYDEWFNKYNLGPKLMVKTDNLNFVDNPDDIKKLVTAVRNCLRNKGESLKRFL